MRLIGLTGKAGCGKDTAAEMLSQACEYEACGFADPLRAMVRATRQEQEISMNAPALQQPAAAASKPKKVSYELIERDGIIGATLYRMLDELIDQHHWELRPARFALAWNLSWKPDEDGRVTLGKCKKTSDLDKAFSEYDFVIVLRREFFQDMSVTQDQRRALLDHELCHAAPKLDKDGEQVEDERGRKVWRIRKHDIEEFSEIVQRHGCYKRDLERFALALMESRQSNLDLDDQGKQNPQDNEGLD